MRKGVEEERQSFAMREEVVPVPPVRRIVIVIDSLVGDEEVLFFFVKKGMDLELENNDEVLL